MAVILPDPNSNYDTATPHMGDGRSGREPIDRSYGITLAATP